MVSLVPLDITSSSFLVSCLVSIYVTEDVVDLFDSCFTCGRPVEIGQIGVWDWQHRLLLHSSSPHSDDCISKYQEYYLKLYPNTTTMQMMILFGISRRTVMRRRSVLRGS